MISLALDDEENIEYRDPKSMSAYLRFKILNDETIYILLDEARLAITGEELKKTEPIRLYGILNGSAFFA